METEKIKQLEKETGVVLVEFYASWCPHCQKMMPVVADVKALFEGRASVYQFDIDENSEFADSLDVKSIPTFIIFKNGEPVWRTAGELTADKLSAELEKALS
ncbi:MAG: thioredoxin family protein [Muribaculaceae bacterium]|nr:thioredoxin family protein [Muribaculaceae bacterium]